MKYFFSTSNYGVYFYLIGSLIYYFQALKADDMGIPNMLLILVSFVLLALLIVYRIAPLHKTSK